MLNTEYEAFSLGCLSCGTVVVAAAVASPACCHLIGTSSGASRLVEECAYIIKRKRSYAEEGGVVAVASINFVRKDA